MATGGTVSDGCFPALGHNARPITSDSLVVWVSVEVSEGPFLVVSRFIVDWPKNASKHGRHGSKRQLWWRGGAGQARCLDTEVFHRARCRHDLG